MLTEGRRFKGSLADLEAVTRARVELPVLRKDFIATRVPGARGARRGRRPRAADRRRARAGRARATCTRSIARARHDAARRDALGRRGRRAAIDLGARLIGVNARDLSTFELDRDLFGRLAERIPADAIKIAESAVLTPADVAHYRAAGADVVLIGEALVTGDPVATLNAFPGGRIG